LVQQSAGFYGGGGPKQGGNIMSKYIKKVYIKSIPNEKDPKLFDNLWAYHYKCGEICGSWFGPSKTPKGWVKQTGASPRPPLKLKINENGEYVVKEGTYWYEGSKAKLLGEEEE
jgi:hypothetical protein